jgi:hypothetical protein
MAHANSSNQGAMDGDVDANMEYDPSLDLTVQEYDLDKFLISNVLGKLLALKS